LDSKPEKIDFNFNSKLSADRKKFLRDPNYAEKGQIFHFFETELGNLPRGRGGIKVGVGPGEFPKYLNFPFLTIFKNYHIERRKFQLPNLPPITFGKMSKILTEN
jgi:hypothetical protein